MKLIAEIKLETSSFSVDPVESKAIPREGFEVKMCFESNTFSFEHEGDETPSLNDLEVESNLDSFRWKNFDLNESSDIEVEYE